MLYNAPETIYHKEAKRLKAVGVEIIKQYLPKIDPTKLKPSATKPAPSPSSKSTAGPFASPTKLPAITNPNTQRKPFLNVKSLDTPPPLTVPALTVNRLETWNYQASPTSGLFVFHSRIRKR